MEITDTNSFMAETVPQAKETNKNLPARLRCSFLHLSPGMLKPTNIYLLKQDKDARETHSIDLNKELR